jgi:hypothetical protein
MARYLVAAVLAFACHPALGQGNAVCTLSADKKTVTVTATNPYQQVMACEVNCDMAVPNGIATVVCVKPVPVGAKDFVMCSETAKGGRTYTRVRETIANCPDPSAPASSSNAKDDDDDEDAEALIKNLQKQGQEFIERQRRR